MVAAIPAADIPSRANAVATNKMMISTTGFCQLLGRVEMPGHVTMEILSFCHRANIY